jgi:hypothetical protein
LIFLVDTFEVIKSIPIFLHPGYKDESYRNIKLMRLRIPLVNTFTNSPLRARFVEAPANIIVASIYAIFMLVMQYSKHKWVITHPTNIWNFLPILHAELIIYLIITTFIIIFICKNWVVYALLTAYYIINLLDFITWFTIHRPFHPIDLVRSMDLIAYYPDFFTVNHILALRILIFALVPLMAGVLLWWLRKLNTINMEKQRVLVLSSAAIFYFCYIVSLPFVLSPSYMNKNSIVKMSEELLYSYQLRHIPLSVASQQKLFGTIPFKHIADVARDVPRQMNVIVFVIETAPYQYYPDLGRYAISMGLKPANNTAILNEHYTTYPESDRSFLSMMTGKYPPLQHGSGWVNSYNYDKALPRILKGHGYKTCILSTAPLDFHNNRKMLENLGFDYIYESEGAKKASWIKNGQRTFDRTKIYAADLELIDEALRTISLNNSRRYLLAILPQSSHAPFQRPPGYTGDGSQKSLIEANALWQFGLITKIVKRLEETLQSERTIMIITGDHGLRHPLESFELFSNMDILSPLTFHVPFLLYSGGGALSFIPRKATSHIDILPTLLELLGIRYKPDDYHGRSIYLDVSRKVFFLGGEYLPVSGFKYQRQFFMENRNRSLIFSNSVFDFSSALNENSGSAAECNQADRLMISNELRYIEALLRDRD